MPCRTVCFTTIFGALILAACSGQPAVIFHAPETIQSERSNASTSDPAASMRRSGARSRPESVLIDVPFAPQAPFANWDPLHEEACEEASLILVHHYLEGRGITPEQMESELQALIAWETEHGYGYDVTVEELGAIASAYYDDDFSIENEVTGEKLRSILSKGSPVIIPVAGRDLGNPYFSGEGPWYHMLVVIGYDQFGFITNDVGTKRGRHYRYSDNVLLDAIHNWTGRKEEIRAGPKKALVLRKL